MSAPAIIRELCPPEPVQFALAFPWLLPTGPDYRNLRAAWDAGYAAARDGDAA